MKKILALVLLSVFVCASSFAEAIKVACVGDSITYGSGIKDRAKDSYPAQLGKMLGDGYDVRNFGVGGATLLSKGNKPYVQTDQFVPAMRFLPDIVIIKLGTNDSKPFNWIYKSEFEGDLNSLIDSFSNLPSKPVIFLCRQVPAYQDKWGITESVIAGEIFPIIKKIAKERGITVIDMHTPLENKENLFPDKIHPNAEGAKIMAQTAAEYVNKAPVKMVSSK